LIVSKHIGEKDNPDLGHKALFLNFKISSSPESNGKILRI
jgi:hypothetical protein